MGAAWDAEVETFNPWSVVNLVFEHLVDHGLHPVLGDRGDPGASARDLLRALGIEPAADGNREVMRDVYAHLAEIRAAMLGEP
jgi:hypothetical protein